jgi:uncharacterized protein with FMN-binding domain
MNPLNRATLSVGALAVALSLAACSSGSPSSSTETNSTPSEAGSATPQNQETPEAMTSTPPTAAPAPDAAAPAAPAADSEFRDGEYSATGWYGGLPSHHDVTLTIENDLIVDVEINTPAEDETSLGYQQRFVAALPDAVVGRDISDLTVDRLAGSSGCSEGFMDALAQIKEQAAA